MPCLDFSTLVHSYCQQANLPAPTLSDAHHCVIHPAGGYRVFLTWDAERDDLVIVVPLREKANALDAEQAYEILCAAFVGQNFHGAAIGIDPRSGALSLWRRVASEAVSLTRLTLDIERTIGTARQIEC